MKTLLITSIILLGTSCVTKGRYETVVSSVRSKEKQKIRLEKQRDELLQTNARLKDSAERLGD